MGQEIEARDDYFVIDDISIFTWSNFISLIGEDGRDPNFNILANDDLPEESGTFRIEIGNVSINGETPDH